MFKTFVATACALGLMAQASPVFAEAAADDALRFLASIQWECDDRIAFDGAEGGLHDTVSALKVTFDDGWRFTGYFNSSLVYGENAIYTQHYNIAGYAFDEDGQSGIMIDSFTVESRRDLPEGIGWRDMERAIYYIDLVDGAMSLRGTWEDTVGGRGPSLCG